MSETGHRLAVLVAFLAVASPASAQIPFSAYYLHVGLGAASGPHSDAGAFDFQRARLMLTERFGAVRVVAAYEHLLTYRSASGTGDVLSVLGAGGGATDFLPLQGELESSTHFTWRHRVDRASVTWHTGRAELSVGRQAVAWATTLFLSPADPFGPFDPSDPFREYRVGVDVARAQFFPGPFSQLDLVFRPAKLPGDTTITALARAKVGLGTWELSGWGGVLHDQAAGAAGLTVTTGGAAVRGEIEVRRDAGRTVTRFAVGIDRSFQVFDRTLYAVAEYQHDGFGAANAAALAQVFTSAAAARGELQVAGRDELAFQASYQVHPLWSLEALGLVNVGDGSTLLSPAVLYSLSADAQMRVGGFVGLGSERLPSGLPGSEYGVVPVMWYASLTVFF